MLIELEPNYGKIGQHLVEVGQGWASSISYTTNRDRGSWSGRHLHSERREIESPKTAQPIQCRKTHRDKTSDKKGDGRRGNKTIPGVSGGVWGLGAANTAQTLLARTLCFPRVKPGGLEHSSANLGS